MSLLDLFRYKKQSVSSSWQWRSSLKPEAYLDEDGRRHRSGVPYLLPKDPKEIMRLDYQHYIFRHVLQGNTFAPVDALLKHGANVLDVGCGTARWDYEIASMYCQTQVIGLDLENVPRPTSMPLNYQFRQGNILHGLPFAAHQFQYTHQRLLVAGIPREKWSFVVGELQRVTCREGWVEMVEMGTSFRNAGPATNQFLAWWAAISATRGIDASKVAEIGMLLEGSGFSNVQMKTEILPVGDWGGRIGNLLAHDILAGWPNMRPLAHSLLEIPPPLFDRVIGCLETEWNTLHTCYEVYFACGQV